MSHERKWCFVASILSLATIAVACSGARPPLPDQYMDGVIIRQLDLPIPRATYVVELSRARLFAGSQHTLGEVARNLETLLQHNPQRPITLGWYALPFGPESGFAVLGPTEPLDEHGNAMNCDRFSCPPSRFSWRYLEELLSGVDAHYRVMLFIVTDHTITPNADTTTKWMNAQEERPGIDHIPDELLTSGYSRNYRCNLFIYEFSKLGVDAGAHILQSGHGALDVTTHLRAWNLESAVEMNNGAR